MSHESLLRAETIEPSSNRAFGFVFTTVFALIGAFPVLSGDDMRLWSLAIAVAFLVVTLTRPSVLTQLNRLWLRFGLFLHRIVSPVVLGIMFFLVVTPTGIVMRLLGKDPLRLRYEETASTYWIDRTPPGPAPESLDRQF
jgi:Saxitoxin biosynthesis operon protein SxtJ